MATWQCAEGFRLLALGEQLMGAAELAALLSRCTPETMDILQA